MIPKDTGQWISNTVKKREGPRWLQAYEKAYQTAVSPNADLVVNNAGQSTAAGVDGEASTSFRAQQGRAYSAKELLAMSEHYKDEVTARAARLIVDSSEPGVDDTSIRYWRRAMEEVWDEAPEEEQERFSVQAAELSAQINRYVSDVRRIALIGIAEATSKSIKSFTRLFLLLAIYKRLTAHLELSLSRLASGHRPIAIGKPFGKSQPGFRDRGRELEWRYR